MQRVSVIQLSIISSAAKKIGGSAVLDIELLKKLA